MLKILGPFVSLECSQSGPKMGGFVVKCRVTCGRIFNLKNQWRKEIDGGKES